MPISPAAVSSSATHGAVVPIASYTLTTSNTNFFFTGIPQTYQDLYCVIYARSTYASSTSNIYLNLANASGFDYGANYSQTSLSGNGSSASSTRLTNVSSLTTGIIPGSTATSSIFGVNTIHILNYANTTTNKTILTRSANDLNGSGTTDLRTMLWRNTGGVTGLQFGSDLAFATGSVMSLYGIRTVGQ